MPARNLPAKKAVAKKVAASKVATKKVAASKVVTPVKAVATKRVARYRPDFPFSDLVAGYVTAHDGERRLIDLRTSDGRPLRIRYEPTVDAELLRNLGEAPIGATGQLADLLTGEQHLFAYGIFTPVGTGYSFEAHRLIISGRQTGEYAFEDADWWPRQLAQLARFYRRAQFGETDLADFGDYRTKVGPGGDKGDGHIQETDTLSRFVYGMASAYMLTGEDDFLDLAERGTEYMREHLRYVDQDDDIVYWYHGVNIGAGPQSGAESKLLASEFGDDLASIPAYEQIYALVGPTQTYRVTGDPRILEDIDATLRLFERFFLDKEHGGYFSHIDPIEFSPHHESLGPNRSRKNWNSVGDHAPAYLLNLFLGTGEKRHADMLEDCFDLIVAHFPDPDSPFVQERFHGDWGADRTWGWQQDRAVVGHNLKIAWNLMRMNSVRPKRTYRLLAEQLGRAMPAVALDAQRGGWYDVMDRGLAPGSGAHRLAFHDRKTWWQQEQAILAYLILAGNTADEEFLRQARESAAFYNAFFLDHDEGGVYFNVLANGVPYLVGTERLKGSHSMSMYHASELSLLATVYQRLLIQREHLDLWFRPHPDGFYGLTGSKRLLRVAPDALPPGRVRLSSVEIDGVAYDDFDPTTMTVSLPFTTSRLTVRARLSAIG
jgi:mannose/cellobiose epimerase-like protein (N-acyl-D-glucosamine 2-epimerase family)